VIEVSAGEVFQVAISGSDASFAAAAGDGVVALYGLRDFEVLGGLRRDTETAVVATSAAISPNEAYVVIGYGDW
jgi:hypothetical protein